MNSSERAIYIKYAYDKTFSYIWRVYAEFEIRVNYSPEEYEGIKTGECRFDYDSWSTRLSINKENTITRKQMIRAIKELTETDKVIKLIQKGVKGNSSIYYLNRFDEVLNNFEEQKKEQNEEQNEEQNKSHNHEGLEVVQEQNEEQNEEQKKGSTSKYNNLSIKSKNNNSAVYDEIINYLNEKTGSNFRSNTKATQGYINARVKEGFTVEDFKSVIDVKTQEWLNNPKMVEFLRPKTLFNGDNFEGYLNQSKKVIPITRDNKYQNVSVSNGSQYNILT